MSVHHRLSSLNQQFSPMNSSRSAKNLVKVTYSGKVALLQLNPPTKLVYLGHELMQAIADELLVLERAEDIKVAIITGKG